jgi:hypothetical protein
VKRVINLLTLNVRRIHEHRLPKRLGEVNELQNVKMVVILINFDLFDDYIN